MTTEHPTPTPDDCEDLADQLAARLLEARRESRRRFWSRVGYLLMLLGAASGLLSLLVMLWERWF
jgi:hypothetical protein